MKYFFIMNPSSGKRRKRTVFIEQLKAAADREGIDYELYFTREPGDGARYVRHLCEKYSAEGTKLRIYGCGGDGTVNELVNGGFGFKNVEIGIIPLGTGNDYIRNYGTAADFLDLKRQIRGSSRFSDLIRYRAEYEGTVTEGCCANMFNIGFDCNVVDMTAAVKKWPLVGGSLAYLISVGIILIKKKGADLCIEYEDGTVLNGKVLLTAVANGCFCGGGVKGAPLCQLDDGLMDVSVISDISRRLFISLFSSYAKGTHLETKKVIDGKFIKYTKEKTLAITANGERMRLCTDGEITTQKRVEFSVAPNAFRFILPAGL